MRRVVLALLLTALAGASTLAACDSRNVYPLPDDEDARADVDLPDVEPDTTLPADATADTAADADATMDADSATDSDSADD